MITTAVGAMTAARISRPLSTITNRSSTRAPDGAWNRMMPVQSGFTSYVPILSESGLVPVIEPFRLETWLKFPWPS